MPEGLAGEQRSSIMGIQGASAAFLVIAAVLNIILNNHTTGYICSVVGMALGIVGIFSGNAGKLGGMRVYFIIISSGAMVFSVVATPIREIMEYGQAPVLFRTELFFESLLFAMFFIAYAESAHSTIKFSKLVESTETMKDFNITPVLRRYTPSLMMLLAVSMVISILVLNSVALFVGTPYTPAVLPRQFADSIEMNSIIGIVIAMAIIFFITAVVLSLIFRKDQAVQMRGEAKKEQPFGAMDGKDAPAKDDGGVAVGQKK